MPDIMDVFVPGDAPEMKLQSAKSLDDLLRRIRAQANGRRRLPSSWPTFGGTEPPDDPCVLSWDATRLLVGTWGGNGSDCEIISREEYRRDPPPCFELP